MRNVDVILAGAGTGCGHNAAAAAIQTALAEIDPSIIAQTIDILDYVSKPSAAVIQSGWMLLSLRYERLYRALYRPVMSSDLVARVAKKLMDLEQRDTRRRTPTGAKLFLATHPLAALWGVAAAASSRSDCPVWVAATDYVLHAAHCVREAERIYVPPGYARLLHTSEANTAAKLQEVGIPLSPSFWKTEPRTLARRRWGFAEQDFVVLFTFGGSALRASRHIELIARLAEMDTKVVLLAGRSTAFRAHASERLAPLVTRAQVRILGFTADIAGLLAASDCVVGKAGGLTVSEAIAVQRPLCIVDRLPGQEDFNSAFLAQTGLGYVARDLHDVVQWVATLRASPIPNATTKNASRRYARPRSALHIAHDISRYVRQRPP